MTLEFMTLICDVCKERKANKAQFDTKTRTWKYVCIECEESKNDTKTS